jgi:3-deoxy-D-manno-octulosonic-acid transferase
MSPWLRRLARGGYSTLLRLLQPAYAARLWWRGRREPLYRHAIGERFGRYRQPAMPGWVWVHAVSLGETRAAAALVDALRCEWPGMRLLLTHGTATGREAGRALLREGDRQTWLPYDTPGAAQRFLRQHAPRVGVLLETEIWPNLLLAAQRRHVPMVLASARLSASSQRRGERLSALIRPAVESLALVLAQSEADAQRLRRAGARDVRVCGNLKFDLQPDAGLIARGQAWRGALGRPVVLAAVTREGEEAALLAAWAAQAQPQGAAASRPLLLIVPRHPQRFDEVAALVVAAGLSLARRSTFGDAPPADATAQDVWLGDSMQEMALYYGLADVALLGGSFEPLGGQNLIEAAACGCPMLMGPHTFNFTEAARLAEVAGAALRVPTLGAAVHEAQALLGDVPRRTAMAGNGLEFARTHAGAAARMARAVVHLGAAAAAGRHRPG